MRSKTNSISINVLSVLIILISLFIGIVGWTNSWFTAEQNGGVQIVINVGELQLNLWQKIGNQNKEIYTYEKNQNETTKSYIQLNGPIIPGEKNPLSLYLENKDEKSAPMYVKFKFELYVRGVDKDTKIDTVLSVDDENLTTTRFGVKTNNDGWYYYQDANENNVLVEKGASIVMMTHFEFDYNQILDNNDNLKYVDSDSIYIKLTIKSDLINWQSGT